MAISVKNSNLLNRASCSDGTKVVCQHFNVHFSVAHGGRSGINQHLHSQKHRDAEKTLASVKNIG
jgi:hypothetical protein